MRGFHEPPKVLIDASNLRVGGGLQVAHSFFNEAAELKASGCLDDRYPWLATATFEASPELMEILPSTTTSSLGVRQVRRRWRDVDPWLPRLSKYDASFTIFGPHYGFRRGTASVAGCADVTSLYPQPWRSARRRQWARDGLRRAASKASFRRCDHVIVEAPHVAEALRERWHMPGSRISVVPNVLNRVFEGSSTVKADAITGQKDGVLDILYVGRGYAHKNHALLGPVAEHLKEHYDTAIRFALTLSEEEWSRLPLDTRRHSVNIGVLTPTELASRYRDYCTAIFPSLLECFSATPLEYMATGTAFAASDRPFVRELCGTAAEYFDPHDPKDAARALSVIIHDAHRRAEMVREGTVRASEMPTPTDRALAYLSIINQLIEQRAQRSESELPAGAGNRVG